MMSKFEFIFDLIESMTQEDLKKLLESLLAIVKESSDEKILDNDQLFELIAEVEDQVNHLNYVEAGGYSSP